MRKRIVLTSHAVERYQERVRPALDLGAVRRELGRILPLAEISAVRPAWAPHAHIDRGEVAAYVVVGAGICFPCKEIQDGGVLAVTCLVVGGHSTPYREARNARAAERRRERQARRWKWRDQAALKRARGREAA